MAKTKLKKLALDKHVNVTAFQDSVMVPGSGVTGVEVRAAGFAGKNLDSDHSYVRIVSSDDELYFDNTVEGKVALDSLIRMLLTAQEVFENLNLNEYV
jgi:Ni,Fe-hydrogenase III large subunit